MSRQLRRNALLHWRAPLLAFLLWSSLPQAQAPPYVLWGPLLPLLVQAPENSWVHANANLFSDAWTPDELIPLDGAETNPPSKIILAWSGFAWDSNRGDVILFGGGHANYPGNEVYRWRSSTLMWERGSLPSEIRTDPLLGQLAIDGVDNAPSSAHTYDNSVFLPIADRFLTWGGAAYDNGEPWIRPLESSPETDTRLTGPYLFDPNRADGNRVGGTTGSHVQRAGPHAEIVGGAMWQNRDIHRWLAGQALPGTHVEGCTGSAIEDGFDVVYVASANESSTPLNLYRYRLTDLGDPLSDQITQVGSYLDGVSGQTSCAYDPVRKLFLRTGDNGIPFQFWDLTEPGPDNTDQSVDTNASVAALQGWLWANEISIQNCGLDYDSARGHFKLWCGADVIWEIAAPMSGNTTMGWNATQRPATPPPAPPGDVATGILGKWRYAPYYDVFVGLQHIDNGDIWIYKPVGWVQPNVPGNALPVVGIASPSRYASIEAQAPVELSASAFDPDGSVAHVEYYVNGVFAGRATVAPWRVTIASTGPGGYSVVAVAVDNAGGMAASAPVPFTVGATSYQGYLDGADCDFVHGWAWDASRADTPIDVDIFSDGGAVGRVPANVLRQDLADAGIGHGGHGFNFVTPGSMKNGAAHSIDVYFGNTVLRLEASPRTIACEVAVGPAAAMNLSAVAISTSQISVSWADTSDNENSFRIERRTVGGAMFAPIASVAANVTSFTDGPLDADTTYSYRVIATNGIDSEASNEAEATTFAQMASYEGYLDAADCGSVRGWAWDRWQPNGAIGVEIFSDDALIASISADLLRPDLAEAGIGDGGHGFAYAIPDAVRNGSIHAIDVRYAGTSSRLGLSPVTVECQPVAAQIAATARRRASPSASALP